MMRSKPASSMQKTYDECYLTCSTAVFFEGQNNEAEALRSWRSALDQIYYHNAYRLPSGYVPRSETEKALFDSLKQLEMQCKERVDLLEALKQSRKDAEKEQKEQKTDSMRKKLDKGKSVESLTDRPAGWLGDQTIPPMQYSELPLATPTLPPRPSLRSSRSSDVTIKERAASVPQTMSPLGAPPTLPIPAKQTSRSPSPDHGRKTMRTTLRTEKKGARPPRSAPARRPAPMKAAGLAWDTKPRTNSQSTPRAGTDPTIEARLNATAARRTVDTEATVRIDETRRDDFVRMPDPQDFIPSSHWRDTSESTPPHGSLSQPMDNLKLDLRGPPSTSFRDDLINQDTPPIPPPHSYKTTPVIQKTRTKSPPRLTKPPEIAYRQEYPAQPSNVPPSLAKNILDRAYQKPTEEPKPVSGINRKPVAPGTSELAEAINQSPQGKFIKAISESEDDGHKSSPGRNRRSRAQRREGSNAITPPSTDAESPEEETTESAWDEKAARLMKNLPKGVDENAAKQILNEIVVKGDEVHWDDVAGLDGAKKALKEAVVYPFLRPDLFMGLREPARGMLLFGPPGTGKTMLARAVATESKSTFFAISASSLTSKWHGESEKLVRALFSLAKVLAPSIIFVDEIDSLLSARSGSSEHEASRRSKTEFLIQWSDLQRAAAGKDNTPGDASRVLVLAATNCPWDIDDAARRRFVRRQYIPLPESETREKQLRTLLGHQKHDLNAKDIWRLVGLTDGYSGSDITALAKDAAMGPLRNLGEALLYTPMDQIRPIHMGDFQASLVSIRPSVSAKGLEQFEEWAKEFGERGG